MPKQKVADVKEAEVLGHYQLRLAFSDGKAGIVDLAWVKDLDGVFEPLRDPAYFRRVEVDRDAGTITWPNGADIAPETLYDQTRALPEHGHVDRRSFSASARLITGGLLGAGALAVVARQLRRVMARSRLP